MTEHVASPLSFEQSLQELDRIVKALEDGRLPLEQAIDLYEKGHALCQQCTQTLQKAQMKIERIRAHQSEENTGS